MVSFCPQPEQTPDTGRRPVRPDAPDEAAQVADQSDPGIGCLAKRQLEGGVVAQVIEVVGILIARPDGQASREEHVGQVVLDARRITGRYQRGHQGRPVRSGRHGIAHCLAGH